MRNRRIVYFALLAVALISLLLTVIWYRQHPPTVRELIIEDEDIVEIVSDLINLKTGYAHTILEDTLSASLKSTDPISLSIHLDEAREIAERFQKLSQQGMMDRKALINVAVKYCIAESIINNNFNVCNIDQNPEVELISPPWSGDINDLDYWVSAEQVMPYFLAGYLNYKVGNVEKSEFQFQKIREYQSYLLTSDKLLGPSPSAPLFAKIHAKATKISK